MLMPPPPWVSKTTPASGTPPPSPVQFLKKSPFPTILSPPIFPADLPRLGFVNREFFPAFDSFLFFPPDNPNNVRIFSG